MTKFMKVLMLILVLTMLCACGNANETSNKSSLFEGVRPGQTVPNTMELFENNSSYTIEKREIKYELMQTTEYIVKISKSDGTTFNIFNNELPFFNFTYDPVKEYVNDVNATVPTDGLYGADFTNTVNKLLEEVAKTATFDRVDKSENTETYYYNTTLEDTPYVIRVNARWGDKDMDFPSNILISLKSAS